MSFRFSVSGGLKEYSVFKKIQIISHVKGQPPKIKIQSLTSQRLGFKFLSGKLWLNLKYRVTTKSCNTGKYTITILLILIHCNIEDIICFQSSWPSCRPLRKYRKETLKDVGLSIHHASKALSKLVSTTYSHSYCAISPRRYLSHCN